MVDDEKVLHSTLALEPEDDDFEPYLRQKQSGLEAVLFKRFICAHDQQTGETMFQVKQQWTEG